MIMTQIMTIMIIPNMENTQLKSSSLVNTMKRRVGGKLNKYPTLMTSFTTLKIIITQLTQSRLFMIWTVLK